jgi:predicted transcriptional regulator of viral defense system
VRGKSELPARVSHVLQVSDRGERGLAQVASAQRAMVGLAQLRGLGISRGSYEHRLEVGALHRVFPSVLSVVHPVLEPWAIETAALLYAGENAVLSHESAAAVWGLAPVPSFVAITLIDRKARAQPGLRLHQVTDLDIRDLTIHSGFPVTGPARTLIDCASRGSVDQLLNEARVLKLATDEAIEAAMARCPHPSPSRRGASGKASSHHWTYLKSAHRASITPDVTGGKEQPGD